MSNNNSISGGFGDRNESKLYPSEMAERDRITSLKVAMMKGEGYAERGNYEKAIEHFKNAAIIDPSNIGVLEKLANYSLRVGDESDATEYFGKALFLDQNPEIDDYITDLDLCEDIAAVHVRNGFSDEADIALKKIESLATPEDMDMSRQRRIAILRQKIQDTKDLGVALDM